MCFSSNHLFNIDIISAPLVRSFACVSNISHSNPKQLFTERPHSSSSNLLIASDLRRMTYVTTMASIYGSTISIVSGLFCTWLLVGSHPKNVKVLKAVSLYILETDPQPIGNRISSDTDYSSITCMPPRHYSAGHLLSPSSSQSGHGHGSTKQKTTKHGLVGSSRSC